MSEFGYNPHSPLWEGSRSQKDFQTIQKWVAENPELDSELNELLGAGDKEKASEIIDRLNAKYLPDNSGIEGMYTDINKSLDDGTEIRIRKDDSGRMDFEIRQ